jgi:16S rRNA (cytosine967-C5)-methyltransferase
MSVMKIMNKPSTAAGVSSGIASRAAALDILGAVAEGKTLDDALAANRGLDALEPRDRGFTRMLVSTTLRRRGQIDAVLQTCLARALPASEIAVQNILRLGACQLLVLDTPSHAAVDTAVQLAKTRRHGRHTGLVNAVLRRITREGAGQFNAQDAPRLNTPDWLWRSWSASYGEATCRQIAEIHMTEPSLDITVREDVSGWALRLEAAVLPTGTLRRALGGPVAELPGFDAGAWWIQDAAASLPARVLLAGLGDDVAGERAIDLCAAPGGKTAQLAAAGTMVTAVDISESRLGILRANLERLGFKATTVAADARRFKPDAPARFVLLDAPCSATGAIRRHPDIPWSKGERDVARLAGLQDALLRSAAAMVAPGGRLVYSVCSLEPDEGSTRIADLLAAEPGLAREPVSAADIGGIDEAITGDGDVRTLPCHLGTLGGMDGFYIARLRRK